jgi:hypothetical protein
MLLLNAEALNASVDATLSRQVVCPTGTKVYTAAEAFRGMDSYWRPHVRSERSPTQLEQEEFSTDRRSSTIFTGKSNRLSLAMSRKESW